MEESTPSTPARRRSEQFDQIVTEFQGPLRGYIVRLVGDEDEAAELLQEVLFKAWRNIDQTTADLALRAWLYRIAHNACMDHLRRRQIIRWLPLDPRVPGSADRPGGDEPEAELLRHETIMRVRRTLELMSDDHRTALLMRELRDASPDEIARATGRCTYGAGKSITNRARVQFRRIYQRLEAGYETRGVAFRRSTTATASDNHSAPVEPSQHS